VAAAQNVIAAQMSLDFALTTIRPEEIKTKKATSVLKWLFYV
jgi:hypothetical protein